MTKKRIIPKLLLELSQKSENVVTGTSINYDEFRTVGSPVSQAEIYQSTISDELMVIFRRESRSTFEQRLEILSRVTEKILMPLSFGGLISNLDEVKKLFDMGIEKIILGRAFRENPKLITATANLFGSQAVIVSIDYTENLNVSKSKMGAGIIGANELIQTIKTAGEIGAGEIALNDVGRDGTMSGTNISRLREVRNQTNLPIIQSCGIGKTAHFIEAFQNGADAVAVGTFFAFVDQNFIQIRSHIRNSGIDIRS